MASDATVISHAADRLAKAIVVATGSPGDPRTLTLWGQTVGVSRGALRVWCAAARVPARSCLDFVRVLRAVILASNQPWDLFSTLDVVDRRSLLRLLDRGGLRELVRSEQPPTVTEFLTIQRFLENPQVVEAVSRHLNRTNKYAPTRRSSAASRPGWRACVRRVSNAWAIRLSEGVPSALDGHRQSFLRSSYGSGRLERDHA